MGITLGFNLAPDAREAARQFIDLLAQQQNATTKLSQALVEFNDQGQVVSRTFKGMDASGKTFLATVKENATNFELLGGKIDATTSSLKQLEAQQKAVEAAARRQDALTATGLLSGQKGLQPTQNTNQINAAEAAIRKIQAAIESGAVSLQRFQQLYNQISANPKQILPNLTAEEAAISRALRNIIVGFDKTGEKAQREGERISISWQGILRLFEAQVIKRVTGAFQSSLVEGAQSAVDFSVRIAEIGTIAQRSGVNTEQWANGLRRLSAQFGNSQADVAEAAYMSLSNQVSHGIETFGFLETALRFAKASVSSAADSVNLLSSAMKSFNIPTGDAERVAATFFKTIELGRVRAKEMADTFGRVGTVASELGVSLEETAAAITTLTIKGLRFSDASTLISNFLLKLIRPTDEMKELFKEWGVASGQAAIATFGFGGVLQRLDIEAQKGTSRLGELFNQIRAFRGAINLTGNSFADFQKDLEAIKDGSGDFNKAVDIVMNSFGDRVRRQLNEVKVFFSEDFGDSFVQAVVKISEGVGGLANVFEKVISVGTPVLVTLVGIKAGTVAVTLATQAYGIAATTTRGVIASLSASMSGLAATTAVAATETEIAAARMAALNAVFGAFGAGFTLGMLIFNQDDQARFEKIGRQLEKIANLKFDALTRQDSQRNSIKSQARDLQEAFDLRFRILLLDAQRNVTNANAVKEKSIINLKEVTELTKVSSKTVFDTIGLGLKNLSEKISESKEIIKSSLKSIEQESRKMSDSIFNERLKFASEGRVDPISGLVVDDQKISIIKARLAEITNLARREFSKGTKESIDEARRLYDEAKKLTIDLFDATNKKQRTNFEEQVRRGLVSPTGIDFDPATGGIRQRFEFTVRTAELERQLKALSAEKLAAEQQITRERERQIKVAEAAELREKARVKAIQLALSEIEKLNLVNDKGEVKTKFKDDPRKILEEFDRNAKVAIDAAAKLELTKRIQVDDFIFRQRKALVDQLAAVEASKAAEQNQTTITLRTKAITEGAAKYREQIDEANSRIASTLKSAFVEVGKATETAPLDTFIGRLTAVGRETQQEIKKTKSAFEEAQESFAKNSTKENLQKTVEALDEFILAYKRAIQTATGNSVDKLPENDPFRKQVEVLESQRKILSSSFASRESALQQQKALQTQLQGIDSLITKIPDSINLIEKATNTAEVAVAQTTAQMIASLDQLIDKARETADEIARIGLGQINFGNPPGGFFGGKVGHFAFGGRGSDNMLAYLNKDETVMTKQASDNWAPILKMMNAGLQPNQAVGGGTVTNVGDININMQGNAPAETNVRAFAKSLRRAIRRGTITLQ